MARTDSPRAGRLAAVLGSWEPPAVSEPPTQPLPAPAVGPRVRRWLRGLWPAGVRVDPGRPGATALAVVAAGAAVIAAVGVWSDRPRAEPVGGLPAVSVSGTAAPAALPSGAPLVVSVSGKVARPGLVRVPDGSRVADVLVAAGGALPGADVSGLNPARRVADGEQVAVGIPAAPGVAVAGGPPGKVNLNSATAGQLDALPGVGSVTAGRIVEWRTRNGRFARVDQLREIDGIGERRFGQLRDLVTV